MTICNIDNCKLEAKGSWISNKLFMIHVCVRHFKKYHLIDETEIPLKPEVKIHHVREMPND